MLIGEVSRRSGVPPKTLRYYEDIGLGSSGLGRPISRTIRELQVLEAELNHLVERAHDINPTDCDPQRVCHLIGAT